MPCLISWVKPVQDTPVDGGPLVKVLGNLLKDSEVGKGSRF